MKRFLLGFFLAAILFISANSAIADVKGEDSATCGYRHPDMPNNIGHDMPLDVKGPAKSVNILEGKGEYVNYLIDKNGFVTDKIFNCDGGKCQWKFEYDSSGRIRRLTKSAPKEGETVDEYTYIDAKNMAIHKAYDNRKAWIESGAIVRAIDANGNSVCYSLSSTKTKNGKSSQFGYETILPPDRSIFTKGKTLWISDKNIKIKTEADAEAEMLVVLNCLEKNVCPNGWEPVSQDEAVRKSNDGEYQKFSVSSFGHAKVYWYKNGLLDEDAGMHDKRPDGSSPHGVYKYKFDRNGNWTSRTLFIDDVPGTLTNEKPSFREVESERLSRTIEYYDYDKVEGWTNEAAAKMVQTQVDAFKKTTRMRLAGTPRQFQVITDWMDTCKVLADPAKDSNGNWTAEVKCHQMGDIRHSLQAKVISPTEVEYSQSMKLLDFPGSDPATMASVVFLGIGEELRDPASGFELDCKNFQNFSKVRDRIRTDLGERDCNIFGRDVHEVIEGKLNGDTYVMTKRVTSK